MEFIWDLPVPLKVECFTWLLIKDKLVVRGRLQRLGYVLEEGNVCPICGVDKEESHRIYIL